MKIIMGLDLSTSCTGYSIFQDKKLIKYGRIKPKTTWSVLERIEFIVFELENLLSINEKLKPNLIIIEDIYLGYFHGKNQVLGFANLARLSGAVMGMLWTYFGIEVKNIILEKAIVARPKVGLKGNCQKAEVQCWVLKTYFKKDVSDYELLIEAIQAKKFVKDINQKEYKKRMNEISKIIENDTEMGEDIADAILLGATR